MDILDSIFQEIDGNRLRTDLLDEICLEQLPLSNQKELWHIFVKYAIENEKTRPIAILEEYFDSKCPTDIPWKLYTFTLEFSDVELEYFVNQLKYPSYLYFTDLSQIEDSLPLARKLNSVLFIENYNSIIEFYNAICDDKKDLIEYVQMLQNGWVKECEEITEFEEVPLLPSLEEVIPLMVENMRNLGMTLTNENKNLMKHIYCISTITDKIEMLGIESSFNDDINMFREFGPLNTSYKGCHTNNRYGGCRMFLCCEYEDFDSDDEGEEDYSEGYSDWFRGCCDVCEKEIRSRYHALRHPLLGGGWQGCLCSEECLRKNTMDGVESVIVDIMMDQMKSIKIRNR